MHAKNLVVNHDGEGQKVKHVSEIGPNVRRAIFPNAFCVKPVGLHCAMRLADAQKADDGLV